MIDFFNADILSPITRERNLDKNILYIRLEKLSWINGSLLWSHIKAEHQNLRIIGFG